MSVLNDNATLPGVLIDYEKEISEDFDPSLWGTTDAVVVIGTAFSGSPGVPTRLYNSDMARYIFGKSYDPQTHRSASLVPAVKDLFDRGCRTIYGMRVGGKEIYKDFKFCDGFTGYRLRLRGFYPSNDVKDCALRLDLRPGLERLCFWKPASRATLSEKRQGLVRSSDATMRTDVELSLDNGLGRDDKLVDLINLFNAHPYNNVMRLRVVDTEGNDVTDTPEVRAIRIGSCFPGIYFLGRDISKCVPYTNVSASIALHESDPKPYNSFDGKFYSMLKYNSDVSVPYPIYAESYEELQATLREVSVTTIKDYDFMDVEGLVDRAFRKDAVDYEEVSLPKFEMYKRLGEGFATTAMAVSRGKKNGVERKPRVIETPPEDANHVIGIRDGIYGILRNAEVRYRVLTGVNADDKISGKIPSADDFKVAIPISARLLGEDADNALLIATPKIDGEDNTKPRAYSFEFHKVNEKDMSVDSADEIYADKVARAVPCVELKAGIDAKNENFVVALKDAIGAGNTVSTGAEILVKENGKDIYHLLRAVDKGQTQILENPGLAGELFCVNGQVLEGKLDAAKKIVTFVPLMGEDHGQAPLPAGATAQVEYKGKDYMLLESAGEVYVAKIDQKAGANGKAAIHLSPLGSLRTMLSDNDDSTLIYVESSPLGTGRVVITTAATDFISLEELSSILGNDPALGRLFTFELTDYGYEQKDEYLEDLRMSPTAAEGSVLNNIFYWDGATKPTLPTGEHTIDGKQQYPNGVTVNLPADRERAYDYAKRIPYKTSDNFARQLAQHCARTTLATRNTHGFIGLAPLVDISLANIEKRVNQVRNMDFALYAKNYKGRNILDSENMPYEIGRYISMTMFQYDVVDKDGYATKENGAAGYAGMVSALPLTRSSTMQPIDISSDIDFFCSSAQLESLTGKGVITVTNSMTKGLCIVDGTTMASSSQYAQRLMVARILDHCGERIRAAAEPFIGLVNNINNRNALKTAIDSTLKELVGMLIYSYKFTILNLTTYTSDARLDINYEIYPINEIRVVNNSITVKRSSVS